MCIHMKHKFLDQNSVLQECERLQTSNQYPPQLLSNVRIMSKRKKKEIHSKSADFMNSVFLTYVCSTMETLENCN